MNEKFQQYKADFLIGIAEITTEGVQQAEVIEVEPTEEYLLPFKFGAVSFAKKTGAYLVPFAINGKYKLFRKSIKITYGKPYKVTGDLEKENQILRDKVYKLMKKGDQEYEKRK